MSLVQKILYIDFLTPKLPSTISLENLITYMDLEFPEEKDGGILVGTQAIFYNLLYMLELGEKTNLKSFEQFPFQIS